LILSISGNQHLKQSKYVYISLTTIVLSLVERITYDVSSSIASTIYIHIVLLSDILHIFLRIGGIPPWGSYVWF